MATKKTKPGAARVSPLNTHLREMQAEAMKRAQEKKIMRQMEQNHLKGGNVWDNGYTN
jgi:hypothetical protein